ncbi:MAG: DUF547 domain-containing protein [Flavobacteriales bacterium]|nr:DUF547 domain-containing protein [Flavobacteriales bacterium]
MKKRILIFAFVLMALLIWLNKGPRLGGGTIRDFDPIRFSQDMLYAAKTDGETAAYLDTLANVNLEYLAEELNTDSRKLAFWLNAYNSLTQIILKEDTSLAETRFYSQDLIIMGKTSISLDVIEHGILRKSQLKYGFGYLSNWFASDFEKIFSIDTVEPRIHFALNCGATSCPPIAFYKPTQIDDQLEIATRGYLETMARFNAEQNVVHAPAIMSWFRGDFGGESGIVTFLKRYNVVPDSVNPTLKFDDFDWKLRLNNFKVDSTST